MKRKGHRLTAHVEADVKTEWRRLARERHMSESALLAAVLTAAAGQLDQLDLSGYTNRERGGKGVRLTLRLTPNEEQAVREAAEREGLPSRQAWIVALIRGRLMDMPTPSEAELAALRDANVQLAAVGRNLNQIAHAANIDPVERGRLTREALGALREAVHEDQRAVTAVVRATLGRWTARGREDDDGDI